MKINVVRAARIGFGLLTLTAIVTEIVVTAYEGSFTFFNFFGYFTIISNLLASILLLYLGLTGAVDPKTQNVRGAITLYMLMTGVIFMFLLANLQGVRLTAVPWDNIVLHYIIPIVIVCDWFILPPKQRIGYKAMSLWLVFPIGYVGYSLIRGSVVNWYPYPFLNPYITSYPQVLIMCLILAVFVITAAFIIKLRSKDV